MILESKEKNSVEVIVPPELRDRVDYELQVIHDAGFNVHDALMGTLEGGKSVLGSVYINPSSQLEPAPLLIDKAILRTQMDDIAARIRSRAEALRTRAVLILDEMAFPQNDLYQRINAGRRNGSRINVFSSGLPVEMSELDAFVKTLVELQRG